MGATEMVSLGIMEAKVKHHPLKIILLTRKRTPLGGWLDWDGTPLK